MDASMLRNYVSTKGAAYSDLPFHLNLISSFVYGCNNPRDSFFSVNTPFFAGEPLAYPIIPNYHAAATMVTGLTTVRYALFVPAVFICFSLIVGIYSLTFYFTKRHFCAIVSLFIFTNLGGLGWTHKFDPKHADDPRRDWIHDWGNGQMEYWFHPIMHIIIPQRSALWSLPLCFWIILMLALAVEHHDLKMFILAGIFTGFLPQLQVHSFVAIAQYAVFLCLITFPFKSRIKFKKAFIQWAIYGIVANVIAFPQLIPFFGRVNKQKKSFLRINPIWNTPDKRKFKHPAIILWWRGLGVFAAISLIFGFASLDKWQITLYIPSIVTFILTNIIRYQPWELDNTKLFYASWIPLALGVVSQYLYYLVRKKKIFFLLIGIIIFVIFMVSMGLSAFMSTWQSFFYPTNIFSENDYRFGLWISENTNSKAVFLAELPPMNPISTIGGRQCFVGYGGWAISHGLGYSRTMEQDLLYRNPGNIERFTQYNISYLVTSIHSKFKDIKLDKNSPWKLIFNNFGYQVYRLVLNQSKVLFK
ncbi:hypothetical protein GPJ56_009071 [Histomonas meleagridis]|uniref:uncharacterized protein n=1 Tax=Histomonas meleagridis TaxID=135588 RepID=UPI00355A228E|nr:hypothetical protein GPJ56_009071 [Histomonas meleagridis]KAH0799272.1 hypothetical protein GO595_008069 [Histomonas meleagridis]